MAFLRDEFANAEAFLAARPAVRVIDLLLPDLCGVLRGKRVDRSDLSGIYQRGVSLPGSMFALDVLGGTIQATGLGFDEGDADRACVPVAKSLFPSPWMGPSVAQLQVQMFDHDGAPFYGDPRHLLDSVLERYAARGWTPVIALELEFYFVDQERTAEGHAQPPRSPLTGTARNAHADQFDGGPRVRLRHPHGDCGNLRSPGRADRRRPRRIWPEPVGGQSPACGRRAPRLRPGDPLQAHRQGCRPPQWARGDLHGQALCGHGGQRNAHACERAGREGPEHLPFR